MQRKLSQTELADKSGVNLKSLSRYELGTSVPPADDLKQLADALQVSADSLLTDDVATVKDMELLRKFEVIRQLTGETRSVVNTFLDSQAFKLACAGRHGCFITWATCFLSWVVGVNGIKMRFN